jgi:IclR-like helix-turn-helix domain-containing protein
VIRGCPSLLALVQFRRDPSYAPIRPHRGHRAPQHPPGGREREDKYFSKVIGKALDIVDILRSSAQPLSLNELTLRVELTKSSVFRILHTLEVSSCASATSSSRSGSSPVSDERPRASPVNA